VHGRSHPRRIAYINDRASCPTKRSFGDEAGEPRDALIEIPSPAATRKELAISSFRGVQKGKQREFLCANRSTEKGRAETALDKRSGSLPRSRFALSPGRARRASATGGQTRLSNLLGRGGPKQ